VVRNGTGQEMADLLLDDLTHMLPRLQQQAEPIPSLSTWVEAPAP
jgi:hypothetical protein